MLRVRRPTRWSIAFGIAFAALFLCLLESASARRNAFVHVRVEGVINPIEARHVQRAVERAIAEDAELLLLTLDTPGGLVTSMQDIVAALSNAPMPVVGYVTPRSAQATSAGAFILLATDIAAMAPGTRIGAAHPVADGKALEGPMDDKVTNSLSSLIKSLASRRGRPPDIAEAMVRKSISLTAEEALEKKVVEILAVNEGDLFRQLNGRAARGGRTLATKGLQRVEVALSRVDQVLDKLADPTLTSILLSVGVLAILYELGSPGVGAGGAIGAVFLVLGLLGTSVLPPTASALLLFVIGFVAIGLEVKLPSHGVLGGAGIVALVLGGMLLVDPDDYFGGMRAVNLQLFIPLVIGAAVSLVVVGRATRKALQAPPATGTEALIGKRGTSRSDFGAAAPEKSGQVFVDGARWQAVTDEPEIHVDDAVEVVQVTEKPTRLVVRRTASKMA